MTGPLIVGRCGTRAGYVAGCRCRVCTDANRDRWRDRQARLLEQASEVRPNGPPIEGTMERSGRTERILRCPGAEGRPCVVEGGAWLKGRAVCVRCVRRATVWDGLVPVARAQAHLRALSERGVGYKAVAAASDVAHSVLCRVLAGEGSIRASSERRILAVDETVRADHSVIDGARVREILATLRARGFTFTHLARVMGMSLGQVSNQARRARTTAATLHAYERLMRRVERGELVPERFLVDTSAERNFLLDLIDRGVDPAWLTARLGFHVQRSMLLERGRLVPKNRDAVRAFRAELEEFRREGGGLPEGWETASLGALGAIGAAFGFAKEGANRGWAVGGLSRGEAPHPKKRRRKRRKLSPEERREREIKRQRARLRAERRQEAA